ncbi:MAG: 1-acyl-sn-glycerol-3-phosphate acyltransferase [Rubricoccaceae bacterium]|nr:1-acyl-sn-glycerol-3-phosphate acyltransferase [Rubricoccaceae bacterium]
MQAEAFDYVSLPDLPPSFPKRGNVLGRVLGRFVHFLIGWRIEGNFPDTPKVVMVAAPHTSNWDAIVGLSAALQLGLDVHFFVKREAFKPPLGWVLKALGGIPVQRDAAAGVVGSAIRAFKTEDTFLLGITPEGTRSRRSRWKTGFHRIATEANVPIVLIALDYGRKVIGPIATFYPSDLPSDLKRIASHFENVRGKNPENETPAV